MSTITKGGATPEGNMVVGEITITLSVAKEGVGIAVAGSCSNEPAVEALMDAVTQAIESAVVPLDLMQVMLDEASTPQSSQVH